MHTGLNIVPMEEIKIHVFREMIENVCPCLECTLCTILKTNKE